MDWNKYFEIVDDKLLWKISPNPMAAAGDEAGFLTKGYRRVQLKGREYSVHRIILEMNFGELPEGCVVDHIDGDKLNNALANLRICTQTDNVRNTKKLKNTTSQYKGVHKIGKRWRASIQFERKVRHLGTFDTELEAHEVYCREGLKLFGDFFNAGT